MHIFVPTFLNSSYYTVKELYEKTASPLKGEEKVKQLMNTSLKKPGEKERTAVLRLEMDYELATLFEAIEEKDEKKIRQCKQKLEKIRQELLRLKAL